MNCWANFPVTRLWSASIRGAISAQSAYKSIRLFDSVQTLTHSRVKTDLGTPVVNNKLSAHKHVFI